jgi:Coenzyme PQQ synthesis protein D (PqqD)
MTFKLRDGVSVAEMEHGFALLDQDSGQYWNLNPTGAVVLRTLLDGGTAAQAAQNLAEHYSVDINSAGEDVAELVTELRSAGLVEQHDARDRVATSRWARRMP